ncbi:MAG: carbohydrate-binding protein [Pirellulaceae bacterium]
MRTAVISFLVIVTMATTLHAVELHVATSGNDANRGTDAAPLRTIQRAAELAQPGDVITVHAGTYRERINPPRGGESDTKRIVYQAAPGEVVEIKGSEVIQGWVKVQENVWKVVLPNSFFGGFNPYSDLIRGDWFEPKGREHHTGAVYLNGDWLTEAVTLDEVLMPVGSGPAWLGQSSQQYLLNVAWLRIGDGSETAPPIPATRFSAKQGTQNAPCSEGGECVGFVEHGNWIRYEQVDFGSHAEQMEIRAASASEGGVIEIRLNAPDGELLGSCDIPHTGGWQSWRSFKTKIAPVSGINTLCLVFRNSKPPALNQQLWFAQVDAANTTIWAQFQGINPNEQPVEINVRRAVFYPDTPGRNYITVRGFIMRHAATPWAPPTAEQIGLIGTHWSRGWIIENNVISHSVCSGIALGKHGDQWDNTSANSAEGYVKTIERGLAKGWNKETIGHHIVRGNVISHCEQTGIVGSLGGVFSEITDNTIHDIHVRRLFTGAEMAGIKLHAAIDVTIRGNHIYDTCLGLWLDWMAQGARVSRNLFHNNGQDLFVEVHHGPFVVDNNLFLSPNTLHDRSQGGAYVHNLFNGSIYMCPYDERQTPFHKAHSTELAGMHDNPSGDNRYYNNLFVGNGDLSQYNEARMPVWMDGNVFLQGAKPSQHEKDPILLPEFNPELRLIPRPDGYYLEARFDPTWAEARTRKLVTTDLLGLAAIPGLPFENADGSALQIDVDYLGKTRSKTNPTPGPFESPGTGSVTVKVR